MMGIWEFQIQIVPVLLALLLVELPNWVRRRTKFFYVPIYFTMFPLRDLNPNLAVYLGEDYYCEAGPDPKDQDPEQLRRRIYVTAAISLFISAVLLPGFAGAVGAFFLTPSTLWQFLFVFIAYKAIGIVRAIVGFPKHAVGSKRNVVMLSLIYGAYLGVAVEVIRSAYEWTHAFVLAGDWGGLLAGINDLVFSRVLLEFLLLAVLTSVFVSLITDRDLRRENLRKMGYSEPDESGQETDSGAG